MKIGLSLDGGGVRGYVAALIMQEIENRLKKKHPEINLINCVDYVAGNSTGAILTGLLNVPEAIEYDPRSITLPKYDLNEIVRMYEEFAPAVFKKKTPRYILSLCGLLTYRYSAKKYEELLNGYFGDMTLDKCIKDTMFVTYNASENRPFFFKRRHALNPKCDIDNEFMTNIIRCSSAAPSYFKPKVLAGNKVFVDGLLTTNNPSMCLYTEMKKHNPDEDIVIINIGTGLHHEEYRQNSLKWCGLLGWALPFFNMLTSGAEDLVKYQMDVVCGTGSEDTCFVLNPPLPKEALAMDNASNEQMIRLHRLTTEWLILPSNWQAIDDIVDLLYDNFIK